MTRPIKRSSTSSTTSMPSLAGVCPNGNVDTIAITGQPVTSAYVALPHLPPDVPGDLALVWDHHQGWAVTIEPDTHRPPLPTTATTCCSPQRRWWPSSTTSSTITHGRRCQPHPGSNAHSTSMG